MGYTSISPDYAPSAAVAPRRGHSPGRLYGGQGLERRMGHGRVVLPPGARGSGYAPFDSSSSARGTSDHLQRCSRRTRTNPYAPAPCSDLTRPSSSSKMEVRAKQAS